MSRTSASEGLEATETHNTPPSPCEALEEAITGLLEALLRVTGDLKGRDPLTSVEVERATQAVWDAEERLAEWLAHDTEGEG